MKISMGITLSDWLRVAAARATLLLIANLLLAEGAWAEDVYPVAVEPYRVYTNGRTTAYYYSWKALPHELQVEVLSDACPQEDLQQAYYTVDGQWYEIGSDHRMRFECLPDQIICYDPFLLPRPHPVPIYSLEASGEIDLLVDLADLVAAAAPNRSEGEIISLQLPTNESRVGVLVLFYGVVGGGTPISKAVFFSRQDEGDDFEVVDEMTFPIPSLPCKVYLNGRYLVTVWYSTKYRDRESFIELSFVNKEHMTDILEPAERNHVILEGTYAGMDDHHIYEIVQDEQLLRVIEISLGTRPSWYQHSDLEAIPLPLNEKLQAYSWTQ
jgi:hypothetical protein